MTKMSFGDQLSDSLVHKSFRNHPFFTAVDAAEFAKEQAEILIQQWRHPLHYFPTFLARSIAVLPDIASKTAITRILNQEVGDGMLMVSSIGTAIRRATGVTDNEWVSIHVQQEPDHVEEANHALLADFDTEQERVILAEADNLWKLWTAFFDRLTVEADINQSMSTRGGEL